MKKKIEVLIVDDHPIIITGYEAALNTYTTKNENIGFQVRSAHTLDEAAAILDEKAYLKNLKIVFLDMRLPPGKNSDLLSGEDFGIRLKSLNPEIKIIVATTFNDNYRIRSILESIDPDAFLVKNDIDPKELLNALDAVLNEKPFYSATVLKMLRSQTSHTISIDAIDRRLLYELSIGTRLKDIPEILPITTSGAEKRKRNLKNLFQVVGEDDSKLLKAAREKGFI